MDESRGELSAGALPVVLADELQLGQLFQNLITNALKFH
jgi:signal transduction histidine kinase